MLKIIPVVLAAGGSSRMGYPKALLPLGAETFLTQILKNLDRLELPTPMIVLGAHEPEIRPGLAKYRILILVNPDPARGQISSMRLAAEHLDPQCQGCLIWPVDHPLVTPALVSNLIRLFLDTGAPLALPCCRGRAGHPAIFGPVLMQELLAAPPDSSPKLIVGRHRQSAALLETVETGTIEDIDTPEDYYRLTGETLSSVLSRRQAGGSIKGA